MTKPIDLYILKCISFSSAAALTLVTFSSVSCSEARPCASPGDINGILLGCKGTPFLGRLANSQAVQLAVHSLAATKEEQLEEKKIEKKPKLAPCLQMFQCCKQEASGVCGIR